MSTFLAIHRPALQLGLFALVLAMWTAALSPANTQGFTPGKYGIGTPAEAALIAALDVDVRADGVGLPAGSGNYEAGGTLFSQLCVNCHGDNLLGGRERGGALIGGRGTLTSEYPRRTVESYWPYATTLFDYIRRAMPYSSPGVLEADQVYSLIAFILGEAKIIEKSVIIGADNLAAVEMPNRDGFNADWQPEMFR
ncbi:MAG: cytochrome c [Alphaproteobacteria bacterium]|jgi:S-disulfanyl-L-cysteine oxidoreductase SoxD|nr:cytochrome c [Alphaproteobacteria bacterium]MBT4710092.1 cytochrome c [Alphaproteobacteria bacterium]MBT5860792.1 cytochrome c [Alphaproteobacteria bacterium]